MTTVPLLQTVPFVHPALAGAALVAGLIPILVHLINRRRFVRVPWAAMSFLLSANRRSARRMWLEQWLLLLVRFAAVVLLGLAIARPYFPASSVIPLGSSGVHRVFVLDNSLSMNAGTQGGRTRFDIAMGYLHGLIETLPSADAVSLITTSRPAEAVIAQPAYDRRFVREQLSAIRPTQRTTDIPGAVAAAVDILDASSFAQENRTVYIVSDFPRARWLGDQTPTAAARSIRRLAPESAKQADLNIVLVAAGDQDNVAVTNVALETPLIGVNIPVSISVEVTNFGSSTLRDIPLQLRLDGQIMRRERLAKIEPGGSIVASITTLFSDAGTHLIEAKLTPPPQDALNIDDSRFLSVEVRETTPVLLVDGRPGASRFTGQTGYLATALAPDVATDASNLLEPKEITEPELDGEILSDYAVVVMCNVGRFSQETWRRLERFVSGGGGLFVFSGDLISADNYNRFGYADGAGLIPGKIGRASELDAEATNWQAGSAGVGFSANSLVHPIVADFAEHADSSLFTARIRRYLPIELDPGRGEIVVRYTNGDPALLVSSHGKGRILLSTTTANMDWNNLPAKGDYVSLMLNAMAYLSPHPGEHRNVAVGESIAEGLSAVESSMPLRVSTGDGAAAEPVLVSDGGGLALRFGPIEKASAVIVSIGSQVRVFAANVEPDESDLASADEESLAAALNRPVRVIGDLAGRVDEPVAARATELASGALYLVIALLLLEMWLAMRFGSQRA